MDNDLSALSPAVQNITLSTGRTFEVTPIRVRELGAFMAAIRPIADALASGANIVEMLTDHATDIVTATAIGLRIDRAELDDWALDDLARAAGVVAEVNADFFARRVMPALAQATQAMSDRVAGSISSSGSSPTDTGSET
jgi:hypothetical protein